MRFLAWCNSYSAITIGSALVAGVYHSVMYGLAFTLFACIVRTEKT
jgi:hypothetical protein